MRRIRWEPGEATGLPVWVVTENPKFLHISSLVENGIGPEPFTTPEEESLMDQTKPTLEEVLKHAKGTIWKFINAYAGDIPAEHKEEIFQLANVRLWKAYDRLDPEKGWKSFIYFHAEGAVLDYLKDGKGFRETAGRLLQKRDKLQSKSRGIFDRVTIQDEKDQDLGVERIAGINGVFSSFDPTQVNIRWDLVAHMSRTDDIIHAFALYLKGYSMDEIGRVFRLCEARIGQMIAAFSARFDSPKWAMDPWFFQMVYAFGLAHQFDMEDADASEIFGFTIAWDSIPVDLDSLEPKYESTGEEQDTMFDGTELVVEKPPAPECFAAVKAPRKVAQEHDGPAVEQMSLLDVI